MSDLINNMGIEPTLDLELLRQSIQMRVEELLADDPELLMSYLYRLDVSEAKIKMMLSPLNNSDPVQGFTTLIFDRQIERMNTKKKYKQEPIDGWNTY